MMREEEIIMRGRGGRSERRKEAMKHIYLIQLYISQ